MFNCSQQTSQQLQTELCRRCQLCCAVLASQNQAIQQSHGDTPQNVLNFLWSATYDRENRKVCCPGRTTSHTEKNQGGCCPHHCQTSQKASFTSNNHRVAALLQPLFGKVSSRNVVFFWNDYFEIHDCAGPRTAMLQREFTRAI